MPVNEGVNEFHKFAAMITSIVDDSIDFINCSIFTTDMAESSVPASNVFTNANDYFYIGEKLLYLKEGSNHPVIVKSHGLDDSGIHKITVTLPDGSEEVTTRESL